jgi:photosystem II 13kDa protein
MSQVRHTHTLHIYVLRSALASRTSCTCSLVHPGGVSRRLQSLFHGVSVQCPGRSRRATPWRGTQVAVVDTGGSGLASNPVHPGHGRADDPGRATDQVLGWHERCGHLHVRAAVGVRLFCGARDITGFYMINDEGVLQSVDVSAKFVNGKDDEG